MLRHMPSWLLPAHKRTRRESTFNKLLSIVPTCRYTDPKQILSLLENDPDVGCLTAADLKHLVQDTITFVRIKIIKNKDCNGTQAFKTQTLSVYNRSLILYVLASFCQQKCFDDAAVVHDLLQVIYSRGQNFEWFFVPVIFGQKAANLLGQPLDGSLGALEYFLRIMSDRNFVLEHVPSEIFKKKKVRFIDTPMPNYRWATPLYMACMMEKVELVRLLLRYGADMQLSKNPNIQFDHDGIIHHLDPVTMSASPRDNPLFGTDELYPLQLMVSRITRHRMRTGICDYRTISATMGCIDVFMSATTRFNALVGHHDTEGGAITLNYGNGRQTKHQLTTVLKQFLELGCYFISKQVHEDEVIRHQWYYQPPRLKQFCRCLIREQLRKGQLPHVIYLLPLPKPLHQYLDLYSVTEKHGHESDTEI